jgi:hypothetical protein
MSVSGVALPALSCQSLKVLRLGRPDTKQNSQNFRIGYPLSQRRVEAGTTLLNKGKVKSPREGNRFQVVGEVTRRTGTDVGIVSGNCPFGRLAFYERHTGSLLPVELDTFRSGRSRGSNNQNRSACQSRDGRNLGGRNYHINIFVGDIALSLHI